MAWRKNAAATAAVPKGAAPDATLIEGFSSMALDEGAVTKHKTEKFLILNILETLVEEEMISEENYKICSKAVFSSNKFDAKHIMAYAPPHWELAQQSAGLKSRDNFPSPTLASCFLLIHEVGAYCRLPWRTVLSASVLFQRYCYVSSKDGEKLVRESEFLQTLNYSQRVVLVSACMLLATKVEESLCKISAILSALKVILGQTAFLNAIPTNAQQKRGTHIDVDEAMAWPLRIQETVILEVLGFDVEVHHPHYYIPLFHCLPYSSEPLSSGMIEKITKKSYALLDKCVAVDVPLPLLCSPPVVALAATFLGWILYHPEDATFNWDILRLSDQNKEELRATVDFMVKVIADSDPIDEDYASFLPEAKPQIHHEFQAERCRHVSSIEKDEVICEGTYGTVWIASNPVTDETVALKQLKNTLGRNGFPYYMLREVLFLRRLNHPNVVSGHEVLSKPLADGTREFYIVMEYISFDMRDLWLAQKDFSAHPPWHEGHIKHLTLQLLDAMAYMHQRGLMHRDIKLENILFDSGVLKVADLGSIRDAGRTALKLTTAVVTLWYRPPELLLGNTHYTNAIDIWSIGCVIVEMLAMSALFPGRDVDDMMHRIVACVGKPSGADWQAHFAHLPRAGAMWPVISKLPQSKPLETVLAGKSPACIDLIKKMICYDPTQRISAKKAMSHPYFQEDPKPEPYRPRQ